MRMSMNDERRGPGRPTTGTKVQVRIPPDVLAEVDRAAAEQDTSRADIVRAVLFLWAHERRKRAVTLP